MAEAIVSVVLEQLASFIVHQTKTELSLVGGARKAVENLRGTLETIQAVLGDAEEKQVQEKAVKLWVDRLKEAAYDMDDVVDEWNTSMLKWHMERDEIASSLKKKVCFFFLSPRFRFRQIVLRRRIALKIKDINERLDVIAKDKIMQGFNANRNVEQSRQRVETTSYVDVSDLFGRDEEKKLLVSRLLSENSDQPMHLQIISILGMGGIGKTSLAQLVYNDKEVIKYFEKRIWICVSEPFDEFRVAKAIIEALTGQPSHLSQLQTILGNIAESIRAKKFLLVLDDVWTEEYDKWRPFYNCLKHGVSGSKIIVTTRKETVTGLMESNDIIHLKELNEEKCWLLFSRLAFFGRTLEEREKLTDIGRKIVSKCKGLPLAIKVIGSLLRFKNTREEWQDILKSEMWKLEKFEKDVFRSLLLSYNDLPFMVKQCFSYCAIFPKDFVMDKDKLIRLWMAQGYLSLEENKELELIGQEYFDNLTKRSLFQDFEKDDDDRIVRCKMHDIVHDFAQFLTEKECFIIDKVGNHEEASILISSNEKAHHARFIIGAEDQLQYLVSICNIKKLRSLLFDTLYDPFVDDSFSKLLCKSTNLRALGAERHDYYYYGAIEPPKEIKNFVHLRYLSLHHNQGLFGLPEALCELYNLQTLDIAGCINLRKLPRNIKKLINLRHLINSETFSLKYMPKGIETLTRLRTLSEFVVSDNTKACRLGGIQHLTNLSSLVLKELGHVKDVDELTRAKLKNQQNLICLDFYFEHTTFCYPSEFESLKVMENDNHKIVLEALEPPQNLEKLNISIYGGNTISPYWMMSLTNLRVLRFARCGALEHLPPLGKLPSLESLCISIVGKITSLGNEFLGIESESTSTIAFPKLKSLTFEYITGWERWDYEIREKGEYITIMPCLRYLKIYGCRRLKTLPESLFQSATLETLLIESCPQLEERWRKKTGDYWRKTSHIPNIQMLDWEGKNVYGLSSSEFAE